jgi:hypothetical protein
LIEYTDVGCWIVKGDPNTWDYFTALAEDRTPPLKPRIYPGSWTLGRTYRNDLMRKGDLIALWITGPKKPGIYEFGWVTSEEPYESDGFDDRYAVDRQRARQKTPGIDYAAVRLRQDYIPRPEIKADPVLSGCEQFKAPQGSNPSYLDAAQASALARLIAERVPMGRLKDAKWARLLR